MWQTKAPRGVPPSVSARLRSQRSSPETVAETGPHAPGRVRRLDRALLLHPALPLEPLACAALVSRLRVAARAAARLLASRHALPPSCRHTCRCRLVQAPSATSPSARTRAWCAGWPGTAVAEATRDRCAALMATARAAVEAGVRPRRTGALQDSPPPALRTAAAGAQRHGCLVHSADVCGSRGMPPRTGRGGAGACCPTCDRAAGWTSHCPRCRLVSRPQARLDVRAHSTVPCRAGGRYRAVSCVSMGGGAGSRTVCGSSAAARQPLSSVWVFLHVCAKGRSLFNPRPAMAGAAARACVGTTSWRQRGTAVAFEATRQRIPDGLDAAQCTTSRRERVGYSTLCGITPP